jgi:hypothetical protein
MIGTPLRIVESTAACAYERVRTYPKRRAKSPRHWARMDKKYLKRYGQRLVPIVYLMDTSFFAFGMRDTQVLVVHPSLASQCRKMIDETFKPVDARGNRL